MKSINDDGRIHMVPSKEKGTYFLRFSVTAVQTESRDIEFAWKTIVELAEKQLATEYVNHLAYDACTRMWRVHVT